MKFTKIWKGRFSIHAKIKKKISNKFLGTCQKYKLPSEKICQNWTLKKLWIFWWGKNYPEISSDGNRIFRGDLISLKGKLQNFNFSKSNIILKRKI